MKRILCIDGGGIRGIVPALVLEHLEQLAGRPIADLFDLVSGTSTGGILTCALTCPGTDGRPEYSAAECAELYRREGGRIFHRSLMHRIKTADGYAGPKYPINGLKDVMREYFGEVMLHEALTRAMVTAYDLGDPHNPPGPVFWKSHGLQTIRMRDVATATACAPTYFPPYEGYVDGGIFGTNVSAFAAFEARDCWPGEDLVMLSIGTGQNDYPRDVKRAEGAGPIGWMKDLNLLGCIFDGQSDAADHNAKRAIGRAHYLRLQFDLTSDIGGMDDVSKGNLVALERAAQRLIRANDYGLREFAKMLTLDEVPA